MDKRINEEFKKLIGNHLFYDSYKWWIKALKEWQKYSTDVVEYKSSPVKIGTVECKYIPDKIADKDLLDELYEFVISADKVGDLNSKLSVLRNYSLPSTAELSRGSNGGVLIIGGGPVGLFTAINLYVNKKIDVLVIDNRIVRESIRMPYTRNTQFSFDVGEIDNLKLKGTHFDFINVFENILYLIAYHNNVPMYFTDKLNTFKKILKFMDNNYSYLFDCTGGRLKTNISPDVKWPIFKRRNMEVKYTGDNKYKLFVDGQEYSKTTVLLKLYNEKMEEYSIGNMFEFICNDSDEQLIKKYSGKCMTAEDFIELNKRIKDDRLRSLYYIILEDYGINPVYVKISSFSSGCWHAAQAAKIIDDKLYVGLGETLGVSLYGIHLGVRKGIQFSKKVSNILFN